MSALVVKFQRWTIQQMGICKGEYYENYYNVRQYEI